MESTLMDKFADPALIDTLSVADKATGALITTCMGMGITFVVLVLLWGVIALMSKAVAAAEKKPAEVKAEVAAPVTVRLEEEHLEDAQLVAVITAAIEAYEGKRRPEGEKLVVRKIIRQGNAWGKAGVEDCNVSRRMC